VLVSAEWPRNGHISFKNADLRYRPTTELVLKNVSFDAPAGLKIGIVGRTGAGKSTISNTLSRIVELERGSIEIDGVDIAKVELSTLRKRITVIPQDPTLFTGSLRFNIDPLNNCSDERIEQLCKKAGLKQLMGRLGDDRPEE